MNVIELVNWYAQPIHCPFCGKAKDPQEMEGDCRHWLYTGFENWFERSDRYNQLAGLPTSDIGDQWGLLQEEYGNLYDVIIRTREKISNLVEFDVDNVSSSAIVGFSPLEDELSIWGGKQISPYESN